MKRVNVLSALFASAVVFAMVAGDARASNIRYGRWQWEPAKSRWYCQYYYPARGNPRQMNMQYCFWYPNDQQRKGYYYFANQDHIWGRCVCPKSPNYNQNVMQWSKLNAATNTWQELPRGDCPAPANGDPNQAAIDHIPDPPA